MGWHPTAHLKHHMERARHVARRIDDAVTQAARTAIHVAKHVDRGVNMTRPLYTHVARPLMRYGGVPTAPIDRAITTYDSLRRAALGR